MEDQEDITLTEKQEEKFQELLKHPVYAFLKTHFTDKFFDIAYISEQTGESFKIKRQYQNDPERILNYLLRYLPKSILILKLVIIKFHGTDFSHTIQNVEEANEFLSILDDAKSSEVELRELILKRMEEIKNGINVNTCHTCSGEIPNISKSNNNEDKKE